MPRVVEARKEIFGPHSEIRSGAWGAMKKAKTDRRPLVALGMPFQEYKDTYDDHGLQVQQSSAYPDCLQHMQDRIRRLESQLLATAGDGSKSCTIQQQHRPREEKIAPTAMRQSESLGLIHTPVKDFRNSP